MIEPRRRLGLNEEAALHIFVVDALRRDDLHGDDAIKRRVERLEYDAHAAAADELLQQEVAEHLAAQRVGQLARG